MDVQSAANLNIPEGSVRNIHDKDKRLLWSAVGYNVRYDGDTTQQTYTGKNKWYYTDGETINHGITWTRSGTTITGSGTADATSSQINSFVALPSVLPAGTYTASIASPVSYTLEFVAQDSNGGNHFDFKIPAGQTRVTYTTTYDIAKIRGGAAGWSVNDSINITIKNMQFESGFSATSYEPYVGGYPAPNPDYPQDVNVVKGAQSVKITGKNILSNAITTQTFHGVDITRNSDNSLTLNGTVDLGSYNFYLNIGQLNVKKDVTYTISGLSGWSYNTLQIYTPSSIAFPSGNRLSCSVGPSTVTAMGDETVNVNLYFYEGQVYENVTVYPMVEVSNSVSVYEPYQGQTFPVNLGSTELCKIGNYQDYIYKSGDDWYVYKETGKVVLDGDENVYVAGTQISGNNRFFVDGPDDMITNTDTEIKGFLYSDMFIELTNAQSFAGTTQGMLVRANGSKQFAINYYGVTTGSQFKTWISTNNVTVYYALGTPAYTKITDATLITQLNAVHDWLRRYDYYGVVSGNLPIIINRSGII